eukprot:COSAG02_NODE_2460_length_8797_cov_6.129915_4_plen_167_part_00
MTILSLVSSLRRRNPKIRTLSVSLQPPLNRCYYTTVYRLTSSMPRAEHATMPDRITKCMILDCRHAEGQNGRFAPGGRNRPHESRDGSRIGEALEALRGSVCAFCPTAKSHCHGPALHAPRTARSRAGRRRPRRAGARIVALLAMITSALEPPYRYRRADRARRLQ